MDESWPRRVVAIVAQEVRAVSVGCYGNDWIATPTLDLLASQGVVFDWHFVSGYRGSPPYSREWKFGRFNFELTHDIETHRLPDIPSLGAELRQRGAPTPRCKLEASFAEIQDQLLHLTQVPTWLMTIEVVETSPPAQLVEKYFEDLPPHLEHLAPPQNPADSNDPLAIDRELGEDRREWLARRHAAQVTHFDSQVARLCDHLDHHRLLDDVLLVVTSKQGALLGEYDPNYPYSWPECQTHVPLILRLPGAVPEGLRIARLTHEADLGVTMRHWFGINRNHVHGLSLLPLLNEESPQTDWRDYFCGGRYDVTRGIVWALRSNEWKLVNYLIPERGRVVHSRLFRKPEDRWEVNDVIQQHRDWAEVLLGTLDAYVEATRRPGPFRPPPLPDYSS
jgi:arylsulfatase A-like enzyme